MSQGLTKTINNISIYTDGGPFLPLSGGTVTGGTQFTQNLSAGTIFSGSTDLYQIFALTGSSFGAAIANGLNTYTAGTSTLASVNMSAATLDNLTVTGNTTLTGAITNGSQTIPSGFNTYFSGITLLDTLSATTISANTYSITPITTGVTGNYNADLSLSNFHIITLSGNSTISYTNPKIGLYNFMFKQDSTGNRILSFSSNAWSTPSGNTITLSTGATQMDLLSGIYDGTQMMILDATNFIMI